MATNAKRKGHDAQRDVEKTETRRREIAEADGEEEEEGKGRKSSGKSPRFCTTG